MSPSDRSSSKDSRKQSPKLEELIKIKLGITSNSPDQSAKTMKRSPLKELRDTKDKFNKALENKKSILADGYSNWKVFSKKAKNDKNMAGRNSLDTSWQCIEAAIVSCEESNTKENHKYLFDELELLTQHKSILSSVWESYVSSGDIIAKLVERALKILPILSEPAVTICIALVVAFYKLHNFGTIQHSIISILTHPKVIYGSLGLCIDDSTTTTFIHSIHDPVLLQHVEYLYFKKCKCFGLDILCILQTEMLCSTNLRSSSDTGINEDDGVRYRRQQKVAKEIGLFPRMMRYSCNKDISGGFYGPLQALLFLHNNRRAIIKEEEMSVVLISANEVIQSLSQRLSALMLKVDPEKWQEHASIATAVIHSSILVANKKSESLSMQCLEPKTLGVLELLKILPLHELLQDTHEPEVYHCFTSLIGSVFESLNHSCLWSEAAQRNLTGRKIDRLFGIPCSRNGSLLANVYDMVVLINNKMDDFDKCFEKFVLVDKEVDQNTIAQSMMGGVVITSMIIFLSVAGSRIPNFSDILDPSITVVTELFDRLKLSYMIQSESGLVTSDDSAFYQIAFTFLKKLYIADSTNCNAEMNKDLEINASRMSSVERPNEQEESTANLEPTNCTIQNPSETSEMRLQRSYKNQLLARLEGKSKNNNPNTDSTSL